MTASVFVPINNVRVLDTELDWDYRQAGDFLPDRPEFFPLVNRTFSRRDGSVATLPPETTAVAMILSSEPRQGAGGGGWLTAYKGGEEPPFSSVENPVGLINFNAPIVAVGQGGIGIFGTGHGPLRVFGDVTGYFIPAPFA